MAARTLALAAGGRARAAAAAALGARVQPLAPPLGRGFPCPASLLHPRAPPLLGPRGPGAVLLRPLAPSSFHPITFYSTGTGKANGVDDQDHPGQGGGGGDKRKEAAHAIDAGAKPDEHAAGAKNGTKKPDAAAGLVKKPHPGDDSTTGELSKDLPPGDVSEKSQGDNNRTAGEDSGNLDTVNSKSNPTADLAKKARAGDESTAGDLSPPPADESSTHSGELLPTSDLPKPPAVESSTHSGEVLPPSGLTKPPAVESSTHSGDLTKPPAVESSSTHSGKPLTPSDPSDGPSADEDLAGIPATLLKIIQEQSKENQKIILEGVKEMIVSYSNVEKERSRVGRNIQTMFILAGVFLELAMIGAVGFFFGIQFAVEKAHDKLHQISGDQKLD